MDSNKRKKPSGASYRRKKKARQETNQLLAENFKKYFKTRDGENGDDNNVDCNTNDQDEEIHYQDDIEIIESTSNDMKQKQTNTIEPGDNDETIMRHGQHGSTSSFLTHESTSLLDISKQNENDHQFNFFIKPSENDMSRFLNYHPQQPGRNRLDNVILPFKPEKTFYRQEGGNRVPRSWISFSNELHALFCYICLAFAKSSSVFTEKSGFNKWKHSHERILDHEQSTVHKEAVKTFMKRKAGCSIQTFLNITQLNLRNTQVQKARTVVTRVIQVIKFLGKQGLAFRGHRNEAAYTLIDENYRHGNFLATILLLAKADPILNEHLVKVAEKSAIMKQKASNTGFSHGRGGFISFLSNYTLNKIIAIIKKEVIIKIAESIKISGIYSIMMDSSTDVSSWDQCVFVIRFVNVQNKIVERLIAVKRVIASQGNELCLLLQNTLKECDLDMKNCVADCFDGAANMNGQYNGVSAHLKQINSKHVHTWCHSHVLNLVICDTAECTVHAISLFGLLQELAVFFKDSYKRMLEYEKTNPKLKLGIIGKTRWSSKNDALYKLFGHFQTWKKAVDLPTGIDIATRAVFSNVVISLDTVSQEKTFSAKIRNQANSLKNNLLKFETVVAAMLFASIFEITHPVSKYLQTLNLDYLQAWRQVSSMLKQLETFRADSRCFQTLIRSSEKFIDFMNEKLEVHDIRMNNTFHEHRKANKNDDSKTAMKKFETETYNVVLDTIIVAIKSRFEKHKEFYGDVECFDPRKFSEIVKNGLSIHALDKICELTETDKEDVREELLSFAASFPEISSQTWKNIYANDEQKNSSSRSDTDKSSLDSEYSSRCGTLKITNKEGKKCNRCLSCVYIILVDYRMYVSEYKNLFHIYKFLLSLPMTQVSCERAFSKMKIIKNRLRASMADNNLEAYMLMACESDILDAIDEQFVIEKLCHSSSEFSKYLIP